MQRNMNLLFVSPLGSARGFGGGGGVPVCANFALFHFTEEVCYLLINHAAIPFEKTLISTKVTKRAIVWQRRQTGDMTVVRTDCLFPELIH